MGNLFRTGGGREDCSYSLSYTTWYGSTHNGETNIRSIAEYPIFSNKNIDIQCVYYDPAIGHTTTIVLLDKSKKSIISFNNHQTLHADFKIDLTKYPTAKYFRLETGCSSYSGDLGGPCNVTINVY